MLCVLDLARLAAYFRPVCMFHSVYVCVCMYVCMYVSLPYSSNHFVHLLHELSSATNAFVYILYIPVGAAHLLEYCAIFNSVCMNVCIPCN